MEASVEQIGLGGKPWIGRAEKYLKENIIDEETGEEVEVYKKQITPGELGNLMGISPQKATSILSKMKESPNYEKYSLRGGKCVYKLVG